MQETTFSIRHVGDKLIIENDTDYVLYVFKQPVRPKRKLEAIQFVVPRSYLVWEDALLGNVKIQDFLFALEPYVSR